MKFEDIKFQPGDRIQDSDGEWWTFVRDYGKEVYPLTFEDRHGMWLAFTRKGWLLRSSKINPFKLHLLPETYQPV